MSSTPAGPRSQGVSSGTTSISAPDLRLVLLGKSGHGKSATANTILGDELFEVKLSSRSTTKDVHRESTRRMNGRKIEIVECPGLFDTDMPHEQVAFQIVEAVSQIKPGPHAVLFVFSLSDKFTEEEFKTFNRIKTYFNDDITKYMIVLFTHGDVLKDKNMSIEEYMKSASDQMRTVMGACSGRYIVINNEVSDDRQLADLLQKIEEIGGTHYQSPYQGKADDDVKKLVTAKVATAEEKEVEETTRSLKTKNENSHLKENLDKQSGMEMKAIGLGVVVGACATAALFFLGRMG